MFWFIVLLLLAGAGFYFYQKMMQIEKEIRQEQETLQATEPVKPAEPAKPAEPQSEAEQAEAPLDDPPIVTPEVEDMAPKAEPVADTEFNLEDEILAAVANLPGIKQTELYTSFADVSRKQLQQLLKELADDGRLKREKKGSSYLLYPA